MAANEVKGLASRTARATQDISDQINAIQSASAQAVTAIEHINATIGDMSSIAASVAHSSNESQVSSEAMGLVESAAGKARQISDSVARCARELTDDANSLDTAIADFPGGVKST